MIRIIRLFSLYNSIVLALNFKYIVTLTEKYPYLFIISFKMLIFLFVFSLFYKNKVIKNEITY